MRKVIGILICCLIFLSTMASSAETIGEIRFRDIEWGVSYDEVMDSLSELNLKWNEPFNHNPQCSVRDEMTGGGGYHYKYACCLYSTSTISTDLVVAGYNVYQIKMFFVRTPIDEKTMSEDTKDTKFYFADYQFNTVDNAGTLADLLSKLEKIYGTEHEGGFEDEDHFKPAIWTGENETMVSLYRDRWKGTVHVAYGWAGAEPLLENSATVIRDIAIAEEQANRDTESVDGL